MLDNVSPIILLLKADTPAEVGFPFFADFVGAGGAGYFTVEVLFFADALIEADTVFEPGVLP